MSLILTLNKQQISKGLESFTFTIPVAGIYNAQVFADVLANPEKGFGAGSAVDKGLGMKGGFPGDGSLAKSAVPGKTGLGFGGTDTDGASGNGSGHGAGAGGGGNGFVSGDLGPGYGGVGQGFGASDQYAHSLPYISSPTSYAGLQSLLSVVVNLNGNPIYTSDAIGIVQSAMQFKAIFKAEAGDVVTIVPASTSSFDSAAKIMAAINQGIQ